MNKFNNFSKISIIAIIIALLQSCSVNIISSYDEATDKYLSTLQQNVSGFIDTLEQLSGTEAAAFTKHQQTYDAFDREIRQLEFRVNAIPDNSKTIEIVKNIRLNILGGGDSPKSSLKDIHIINEKNKNQGPSMLALEVCRRNIDQTISAALALELAKKSGKSFDNNK
jgi:phage tail sheath protein FI